MESFTLAEIGKLIDTAAPSLTAIATIIMAIFTWRLWWSTNKLWEEARETAVQTRSLFQSEQRPWIAVGVEIAGNIDWANEQLILPLKFVLKNVGRSPALEVRVRHKMIPGTAVGVFPNPEDVQRDLANAERVNGSNYVLGTTIFPTADAVTVDAMAVVEREDIERLRSYWEGKLPAGQRAFASFYFVVGCVDYQLALHKERHQSGFIRWVYKQDYPEGGSHLVVGQPTRAEELRIDNWFNEGITD